LFQSAWLALIAENLFAVLAKQKRKYASYSENILPLRVENVTSDSMAAMSLKELTCKFVLLFTLFTYLAVTSAGHAFCERVFVCIAEPAAESIQLVLRREDV